MAYFGNLVAKVYIMLVSEELDGLRNTNSGT